MLLRAEGRWAVGQRKGRLTLSLIVDDVERNQLVPVFPAHTRSIVR